MPQLDVTTYPSQLLWLLLTFVPLYLIIVRVALPRIGEVLEARQDKIDDDLKKAAARKEEAQAMLAEYEAIQSESRAKAQGLLRDMQDEMTAETARRNSELGAKLAREGSEAEKRIASAKSEAVAQLSSAVVEVASAATARLIGVTPSKQQAEQAVAAMTKGRS